MIPLPDPAALTGLRSNVTRARRQIHEGQRAQAARAVSRRLWKLPGLSRAGRIACYLAVRGELDCGAFIKEARRRGRKIYLPVLRGRELVFAPFAAGARMRLNRFAIPEPRIARLHCLRARELDAVIAPLVAFDHAGRRLGSGGGFYDRSLRFLRTRRLWRRPRLIGIAFEVQHVESLPVRSWDVQLTSVVTEQRTWDFRR